MTETAPAARIVHRATGDARNGRGARVAGILCTRRPMSELPADQTWSMRDNVNCEACLARLAWIEVTFTGEHVFHWPAPVTAAAAGTAAA